MGPFSGNEKTGFWTTSTQPAGFSGKLSDRVAALPEEIRDLVRRLTPENQALYLGGNRQVQDRLLEAARDLTAV